MATALQWHVKAFYDAHREVVDSSQTSWRLRVALGLAFGLARWFPGRYDAVVEKVITLIGHRAQVMLEDAQLGREAL